MTKRMMALGAVAMLFGLSHGAYADEGMWTFDNFPAKAVNAKYGVNIDTAWLDRVRAASVRLSTGCSASVVSANGLVLTNHHCIRTCAQNLSTAKSDYIKNGFAAALRKDEKMCPGMQAEILEKITDVTKKVVAAGSGKSGQDYVKARDSAIAAVEKQGCQGRADKYRCQVVTLYQGGQYKLYTFRKFSDVRLVAAPEMQMAFFGGDPDNFNFPRYDLDFSFVRLYEGGKPVATPNHLRWSVAAPKQDQLIFVSGNPGSTQRLLTADELAYLRDYVVPDILILYSELRGRLIGFGTQGEEQQRIADSKLFGIENSFKAYFGRQNALIDKSLFVSKNAVDLTLKAKLSQNAQLAAEIGDPWRTISDLAPTRIALRNAYNYMEARAGMTSSLFAYARTLVRGAAEREIPNGDRLPEFTESRLPLVEKNLLDARPVYPQLEELLLGFWLSKLRENLTADAEGTKVFLGKTSPEKWAATLSQSKLADPAYRKSLWQGGMKAIEASDDPMIRFVLATDAASRAIRKEVEEKIEAPLDAAEAAIAKARFAVYGDSLYPDATFSLRLSYGKVTGWNENGKPISPFTTFGGLWQRATDDPPFDLPPRWLAAKGKLNDATVFDFATDNDIIGGNSGSPAITADGHVVGAVFDGNIHSLGGAYFFDPATNRTVIASTAAITEALTKIYKMDGLVKELAGK